MKRTVMKAQLIIHILMHHTVTKGAFRQHCPEYLLSQRAKNDLFLTVFEFCIIITHLGLFSSS